MADPILVGTGLVIGVGVPGALGYLLVRRWQILRDSFRLQIMALIALFATFAVVLIPEPIVNWTSASGLSAGAVWMITCMAMAGLMAALSWAANRREHWLAYQDERAHNGGVAPRRLFSVGTTALLAFAAPWVLILGMAAVGRALVSDGWLDSLAEGLDPNNADLATFVDRVLASAATGAAVGFWVMLSTSLLLASIAATVQWGRQRHAQRRYADDLRLQAERDQRLLDGLQEPYGTAPTGAVPVSQLSRLP